MARGKKIVPDFIPAGTQEWQSEDPTDEYNSFVDIGKDFTTSTTPSDAGLADTQQQTGVSSPQ